MRWYEHLTSEKFQVIPTQFHKFIIFIIFSCKCESQKYKSVIFAKCMILFDAFLQHRKNEMHIFLLLQKYLNTKVFNQDLPVSLSVWFLQSFWTVNEKQNNVWLNVNDQERASDKNCVYQNKNQNKSKNNNVEQKVAWFASTQESWYLRFVYWPAYQPVGCKKEEKFKLSWKLLSESNEE